MIREMPDLIISQYPFLITPGDPRYVAKLDTAQEAENVRKNYGHG
jgi:hypothetical protein